MKTATLFICIVIAVFLLLSDTPEKPEVAKEPSIDVRFWYNFKTQQRDPIAVAGGCRLTSTSTSHRTLRRRICTFCWSKTWT